MFTTLTTNGALSINFYKWGEFSNNITGRHSTDRKDSANGAENIVWKIRTGSTVKSKIMAHILWQSQIMLG